MSCGVRLDGGEFEAVNDGGDSAVEEAVVETCIFYSLEFGVHGVHGPHVGAKNRDAVFQCFVDVAGLSGGVPFFDGAHELGDVVGEDRIDNGVFVGEIVVDEATGDFDFTGEVGEGGACDPTGGKEAACGVCDVAHPFVWCGSWGSRCGAWCVVSHDLSLVRAWKWSPLTSCLHSMSTIDRPSISRAEDESKVPASVGITSSLRKMSTNRSPHLAQPCAWHRAIKNLTR